MNRVLQRVALLAAMVLVMNAAAAATHVAAISKNSIPPPSKAARQLPIDVTSSKIERNGDVASFRDIVITQGETRVQADRAHVTGLDDFNNSHWTFEGNVKITGEQHGSLKSDVAIVEFKNKEISKATATGNPAEFQQKRSDIDEIAKGRAKEIVYDFTDGTVRLSEEAWVWDGHNELQAHELIYNIREQRVQATADSNGGQVHLKIDPNGGDAQKKP
jgi:lipopolysaccharide transport protein LptA